MHAFLLQCMTHLFMKTAQRENLMGGVLILKKLESSTVETLLKQNYYREEYCFSYLFPHARVACIENNLNLDYCLLLFVTVFNDSNKTIYFQYDI